MGLDTKDVGHRPNHEAPSVVGQVVRRRVHTTRRLKDELRLIDEEVQLIPEPWGDISAREIQANDAQLSRLDMMLTSFVEKTITCRDIFKISLMACYL